MKQIISTLYLLFFAFAGQMAAQGSRIMLTQLERGPLIDGSRQGLIGLTNANGDQRYAFYVNVADTCVLTTPTDTGNTVVSIFVQKCATDSIWYIDWEGRSILLSPYGGAGSCDVDWLEISDNSCPDAITDSLYKYKYASVGARYVWPGSELLINDSTSAALQVIQGNRNARIALFDSFQGTFLMIDHGGTSPVVYMPVSANLVFKTTAGTPQTPLGSQVNHFAINAQDSTIQMFQYPETRQDIEPINNFLYTDDLGKIRSQPIDSIPGIGNGIYGGSGVVPVGTEAAIEAGGSLVISTAAAASLYLGDYNAESGGFGLLSDDLSLQIGNIYGNNDVFGFANDEQFQIFAKNNIAALTAAGYFVSAPFLSLNEGSGSAGGVLRMFEPAAGDNYTEFKNPALSDNVLYTLPPDDGAAGEFLQTDGAGVLTWEPISSSGTVTSVGLSLPSFITVSGSPVTTSGTLTGTLANQTANRFLVGPISGAPATPTFRSITAEDIGSVAAVQNGNSFGGTMTLGTNDAQSFQFETNGTTRATLNTTGVFNVTDENAATNTVVEKIIAGVNSTGTPSTGFGVGIGLYSESSTTDNQLQGSIETRWSTATHASRTSEMDFITVNSGSEVIAMTIEGNGDVGIGSQNPLIKFCNGAQPGDGDLVTSTGMGWSVNTNSTYAVGFSNTGSGSANHCLMVESNATDNVSRALTVSVGSTPTRVFSVNCDQKVGILDITPESELDVTGTTSTNHLVGQNLTPTISVNTAGAGTGASASMTNAQSSDVAGRFSITSGTGATTGLWATITFDDAFTVTPIVQVYNEDADASNLKHYVNINTTSFEFFVNGGQADATVYEFNFIIIGGK